MESMRVPSQGFLERDASLGERRRLTRRGAPGSTPLAENFHEGSVMAVEALTAFVTPCARAASPTLRVTS